MHKITGIGIIAFVIVAIPHVVFSQRPAEPQRSGLLYRISGKGLDKPSYIFGTVHLTCPEAMFPLEKINTLIAESERLVLEVDMDDPSELAGMVKALVLPGGKSFREALTPKQFAKVNEYLIATVGVPAESVQTFSPIALQALILSSPKISGCAKTTSYEEALKEMAVAAKKPVEGLETAAFQTEVLAKIPVDVQAKMLYEMAVSPEKAIEDFRSLKTAYQAQDSDLLYEILSKQMESGTDLRSAFLDSRNNTWVPKVESMMKERSSFFAVGGGHLGGDTGLITRLRELGYTVEAIKL